MAIWRGRTTTATILTCRPTMVAITRHRQSLSRANRPCMAYDAPLRVRCLAMGRYSAQQLHKQCALRAIQTGITAIIRYKQHVMRTTPLPIPALKVGVHDTTTIHRIGRNPTRAVRNPRDKPLVRQTISTNRNLHATTTAVAHPHVLTLRNKPPVSPVLTTTLRHKQHAAAIRDHQMEGTRAEIACSRPRVVKLKEEKKCVKAQL